MFLTQIYGTVLGGFINYALMISIVGGNKTLLADSNGNSAWSGAQIQSYNTNASTWALADYLYKQGAAYSIVPYGLAIGAAIVAVHRITVQVHIAPPPAISSCPVLAYSIPVHSKDWQILPPRNQFPAVHPIRRLYSLQPVPNMRVAELDDCWVLYTILSSQLPTTPIQGLLISYCRCF
jgi:hypothetical protein